MSRGRKVVGLKCRRMIDARIACHEPYVLGDDVSNGFVSLAITSTANGISQ
jgi:hypothetical protein